MSVVLAAEDAVWFGTDAGISRYTGEWRAFHAAPETALEELSAGQATSYLGQHAPPGHTTALAVAMDGTIWAGTSVGAVARWDGTSWHLVIRAGPSVHALAVTEAGTWLGTHEGLYLWDGVQVTLVDAVGRRPVHALAADADTLWVGTVDGLWRWREARWVQVATNERWLAEGVIAVWIDAERTLWVGTEFGLGWRVHSSSRWQYIASVDEQDIAVPVQALASDHSGAIWAGTDGAGVFTFDPDDRRSYSYGGGSGLNIRFVRDVAVDQDGSIWLATPGGVFRYQAYMWYSEELGSGADDNLDYVNDLLVDQQGQLWIATGGAGVRRKTPGGQDEDIFGEETGIPGIVYSLAEDDAGHIWAGTQNGLYRFDENGDAAQTEFTDYAAASETANPKTARRWHTPPTLRNIPGAEVISLLYGNSILWIGTDAGLAGYHVRADSLFIVPELRGKRIEALALDGTGALWIGADPGLHVFDAQGNYTLHRPMTGARSGLPGGPVTGNGLAPDPHNRRGLWVNLLDVGLVYWDGSVWHRDPMGEHVAGSLTWRLTTATEDGSLWVGSETGVTRFDGTTWALITAHDGLRTASIHAIVAAPQGGYWIGGRNGLTHYRPDTTPPWIRVSALATAATAPGSPLEMEAGTETFLSVAAGDLQTPAERIKVAYRVGTVAPEGVAWDEWQASPLDLVPFTLDMPGQYLLEFQARDLSFNYSEPARFELDVIVPARFIWVPVLGTIPVAVFRTLVGLGLIVVGGSAYISVELVRHRRQSLEALRRKFNPYISGEPVRRDDMFFGRRALLQRIVDTLHHNSIMIHGERRIGKTTLLYQLTAVLREVDDPDYWFVPAYIDLEGTRQPDFFHYLMEEIVHAVESALDIQVTEATGVSSLLYMERTHMDYTDREFNRDLRAVVAALQVYGDTFEPDKQARLILLMDEMDVVSGFDQLVQQQLRRIFMREFAATVGAVVAGIRISKTWDRVESPWFNMFNEIALEPFTREQGRELLVEPVKGYYRYRPETIDYILDRADGRPFRIQQYGLEAVNQMLLANRRTVLLEDAQAAHRRLAAMEAAQAAFYPDGLTEIAEVDTWQSAKGGE